MAISNAMRERPEAAEIWFLRRMLSISWLDRLSNEKVLRKADTRRKIIKMTTVRHIRFLGHVHRKGNQADFLQFSSIFMTQNFPCIARRTSDEVNMAIVLLL